MLPECELFFERHWDNECLIAVTKVNGTPCRSFVDIIFLHPIEARLGGHKVSSCVILKIFHIKFPFLNVTALNFGEAFFCGRNSVLLSFLFAVGLCSLGRVILLWRMTVGKAAVFGFSIALCLWRRVFRTIKKAFISNKR